MAGHFVVLLWCTVECRILGDSRGTCLEGILECGKDFSSSLPRAPVCILHLCMHGWILILFLIELLLIVAFFLHC